MTKNNRNEQLTLDTMADALDHYGITIDDVDISEDGTMRHKSGPLKGYRVDAAASPYEVERFFTGHGRGHTVGKRQPQVGFKRLTPGATLPSKAHKSDSGWDLCASEDVVIAPGDTAVIPTGIAVKLPTGFEAQVRPRSGVTSKTKLRVAIGTVDQSYVGEVGVIVDNAALPGMGVDYYSIVCDKHNATPAIDEFGSYKVRKGERIAQLVITRLPELEAVEIDDLGESERGNNGFGSSGY